MELHIVILIILAIIRLFLIPREFYASSDRRSNSYDIVIIAGASNAGGFAKDDIGTLSPIDPDIHVMARDFGRYPVSDYVSDQTVKQFINSHYPGYTCNNGICDAVEPMSYHTSSSTTFVSKNFSLEFARRYKQVLQPGRKILIINGAYPATGLAAIYDTGETWSTYGDVYQNLRSRVMTALSWNKNNKVVAFLWSGGETDVVRRADMEQVHTEVISMIRDIKKIGGQNVPCIATGFTDAWVNVQLKAGKNPDKILDIFSSEFNKVVNTSKLAADVNNKIKGEPNYYHFTNNAYDQLGDRIFDAFMEISKPQPKKALQPQTKSKKSKK